MSITPEWALLSAIYQGGPEAMFYAMERGVAADDLGPKDSDVHKCFEVLCKSALKDQAFFPSMAEIKLRIGIKPRFSKDAFDLDERIEQVIEASLRMQLIEGLEDVPTLAQTDVKAAMDRLRTLYEKTSAKTARPVTTTRDSGWADRIISDIQERIELAEKGEIIGLSSLWSFFDEISFGLQRQQVTCIVAKTKMGKTYIALAWLQHIVEHDLGPEDCVYFVSPETGKKVIDRRWTAINNQVSDKGLQNGSLNDDDLDRALQWLKDRRENPENYPEVKFLYYEDVKSLFELIAMVKRDRPALVVIDSFYFLADNLPKQYYRAQEHTKLKVLAEKIHRELAQGCDVPVLLTHQLRGSSKKSKWSLEWDADDIAGSKAIGHNVSVLLGLMGDKLMVKEGRRLLKVMEARNFEPELSLQINFDLDNMNFSQIGQWFPPEDEDEDNG